MSAKFKVFLWGILTMIVIVVILVFLGIGRGQNPFTYQIY